MPASDIEVLVLDGIRNHLALAGEAEPAMTDRDLIERHVERVIIKSQGVEVHLIPRSEAPDQMEPRTGNDPAHAARRRRSRFRGRRQASRP